jgi:ABC-type uncharacterized transport system YnjBCD permease subunit
LSTDEKAGEGIISRMQLEIRALTLLYESDAKLRSVLERSLLESQDEHVTRFLRLVQPRRTSEGGGNVPMAVGEIILASFLTIIGLAAFGPVIAGVSTPQQWLDYFSSVISPSFTSGPLYIGLPLLDFAFSAALLLGAFYSLRRAAKNLKNAGMILESSGR